jgi:hypothetical protein
LGQIRGERVGVPFEIQRIVREIANVVLAAEEDPPAVMVPMAELMS